MATEHRARRALGVVPAMLLLALAPAAHADVAWWEPLALAGHSVDSVVAVGGDLVVQTDGRQLVSADGGRTFRPLSMGDQPAEPAAPSASTSIWVIRAGVVLTGPAQDRLHPDAHAPYLGASAHLIAAPAALPGIVVAVGGDNHVWRRDAAGQWATCFILLPAGGFAGPPTVTSLAAFTQPLSVAIYMATDGYGVLLTEDGGADWIRADPGLPENVFSLATDPAAKAVYAATDQGLFVHHLQSFPAPPVYHDASLYLRWLGIGLVALLATVAALIGLTRVMPRVNGEPTGRRRL